MASLSWFEPSMTEGLRLCVGTMNFGKRTPAEESARIVERALELGITAFDTANVYNDGESERLLGRLLGTRRPDCLIATKAGLLTRNGEREGLSESAVVRALDESLQRLGTDYIDVFYLHAPDPETPIEETLDGVSALLRAGKIRAWGVSNYAAWQILEMFGLCDEREMARPIVSQVLYNLLIREIEIEYLAFAHRFELHTTVYNPLAGGLLVGGAARVEQPAPGSRFHENAVYQRRYLTPPMFELVKQLERVAADEGRSLLELSYAWIAARPEVDSVLLGPASVQHLDAAVTALERPIGPGALRRIDELHRAAQGTDIHYVR
jgi:aryl-alcohol dehydrogenase-like predicted oxidoreductase